MTEAILFFGALVAAGWMFWLVDWIARRRDRKHGQA
jgi:hypothetical protein